MNYNGDKYSKTISMLPQGGEEEMCDSTQLPVADSRVPSPSAVLNIDHEREDSFKDTTDPKHRPEYRPSEVYAQSHFYRLPRRFPREEKKGWFASMFSSKKEE